MEMIEMSNIRNKKRLLITGGNGFIGRELILVAKERGWYVKAATRTGQWVEAAHETIGVGNLGSVTDWSEALEGCEAVVHLAAHVHQMKDDEEATYDLVNCQSTMRLATMASVAGVHRIVFLSTVKVLGETSPGRAFNDADPAAPQDSYALSKYKAEEALMAYADRVGLEVVVLRPPLVYGPGVKANFLAMMKRIARGWPLPIGALQSRRSFCFISNLNDAILTALEHPDAPGNRFLVSDGETLPLPEFAVRLGHALGKPTRLFPVPSGLLKAAGAMLGRGNQIRRLTDDLEVDISGIRNVLDWRPPWTIEDGLTETVRWFRQIHA